MNAGNRSYYRRVPILAQEMKVAQTLNQGVPVAADKKTEVHVKGRSEGKKTAVEDIAIE
jgi:hypothetical protein